MADTDTERLTRRIAALETSVLELIKIYNESSIQRLSRFEAADVCGLRRPLVNPAWHCRPNGRSPSSGLIAGRIEVVPR